ncbi:MAG: DUF4956 domain-containing protein [Ruminococcaceae bacterium]|nr:DUF4956 domain-containing protein [Oscillospiraceae bacterium]
MSLETIFKGLFDTDFTVVIDLKDFLFCIAAALLAGIITALCYTFKTRYTKSFILTLALLPAVVCVVIMMVNGNIGAGVAVAGAFSLVRFRSVPGTAKEIVTIFLAMGAGLIAGMGYLAYALLFTVILNVVFLLCSCLDLGTKKNNGKYRTVKITVPEDLDYAGVFEDVFAEYASGWELVQVKTTNMGSMFRLTYEVVLKNGIIEKEMIDKIRCRNGNLEVVVSRQESATAEL